MDVILHIGAHRTATTTFQHYLRSNDPALRQAGISVWGPRRTRNGLLSGVIPVSSPTAAAQQLRRAAGRIGMNLKAAEVCGLRHVVISDENVMGAPRRNLREGQLYRDVGQRLARFHAAFGARLTRVALTVRPQAGYWSSVMGFSLARWQAFPQPATVARVAGSTRAWRDVIGDVARALPGVELRVMHHDDLAGAPDRRLGWMTDEWDLPAAEAGVWLNRTPDLPELRQKLDATSAARLPKGNGRWQPFDRDQTATLNEAWQDDLFWLRAGADGLATWIEESAPQKVGIHPPHGAMIRGHRHGIEERRLG